MMATRAAKVLATSAVLALGLNAVGSFLLHQMTENLPVTNSSAAVSDASLPQPARKAATREDAYPETLMRPLFMRSRAPHVPPPPAESVAPAPALLQPSPAPSATVVDSDVRVQGIVSDGRISRALLVSASRPQGDWLRVGETIGGWTVANITADGVVLTAGGERLTAHLYPP